MIVIPASLLSDYVKTHKIGYLFNVITNGIRNMPSHKNHIDTYNIWSLVIYLKAMQYVDNPNSTLIPSNLSIFIEDIFN